MGQFLIYCDPKKLLLIAIHRNCAAANATDRLANGEAKTKDTDRKYVH